MASFLVVVAVEDDQTAILVSVGVQLRSHAILVQQLPLERACLCIICTKQAKDIQVP